MRCDARQLGRRSIRMPGYDYTQEGAYFITICAHERHCLFGTMVGKQMRLSRWGHVAQEEWLKTEELRSGVLLDAFAIMPNHLHGIIVLTDVGATRWVAQVRPSPTGRPSGSPLRDRHLLEAVEERATRRVAPTGPASGSIGATIGQIKSAATKRVNAVRNTPGAALWQRNYYEHVIRDVDDYEEVCWYIENNPARWAEDRENPSLRLRRGDPLGRPGVIASNRATQRVAPTRPLTRAL